MPWRRRAPPAATTATATAPPARPPEKQPHRRRPSLLAFDQLPEWLRDNEYILAHYRPQLPSYRACLHSLTYLHNETGNIYSHIIGAAIFLVLGVALAVWTIAHDEAEHLLQRGYAATWSVLDISVVGTFLLCAVLCMGCSAGFHLVACHSPHVSAAWNKCDYLGIVFLIVGSFYPAVFFAFYCRPDLQLLYLGSITVLGVLTGVLCLADRFRGKEYRAIRAVTFSALGCAGVVPIAHALSHHGLEHAMEALGIHWLAAMGALYLTGALLYGARVPERWFPGTFDLWMHSHQLFHVFVVVAAWMHYLGVMHAFDWLHHSGLGDPACHAGSTVRALVAAVA